MNDSALLIELGTEELPPRALTSLAKAFAEGILKDLSTEGLVAEKVQAKSYATPRRLAVLIDGVAKVGPARVVAKKLMPVSVAYDTAGNVSGALQKRLSKEGGVPSDLVTCREKDVDYVWLEQNLPGKSLEESLSQILPAVVSCLPVPKLMSYQRDTAAGIQYPFLSFVRPAHWLVVLHGTELIPVSVLGLKSGRVSAGHRFQGESEISIPSADVYAEVLLKRGQVVASFEERRQMIYEGLKQQAVSLRGSLGEDKQVFALLDEVTALVEYPTVYAGTFDEVFLQVPIECLVLSMRQHQKYFPLFNAEGGLLNRFLIVSNMRLPDPLHIVAGNQKVIRPRLADARFFWDSDRRKSLALRAPDLARVSYHRQLGSQLARAERLEKLAVVITEKLGGDKQVQEDTRQSAQLAKVDLLTDMVGEFPELQGIMGRYYALNDGCSKGVANAIAEHYQPRFAGDELPQSLLGMSLALADRLDMLAGLFAIGAVPTGDKDPLGLRRSALGVVRLLVEKKLMLSVSDLLMQACVNVMPSLENLPSGAGLPKSDDIAGQVESFMVDRLRVYLRERFSSVACVEAVLAVRSAYWAYLPEQVEAVQDFCKKESAEVLIMAARRIGNILRKSSSTSTADRGEQKISVEGGLESIQDRLLIDEAERSLYHVLQEIYPSGMSLYREHRYSEYLSHLLPLCQPVERFFDEVMVNVLDEKIRSNRYALLRQLYGHLNRVADLAKLAGESSVSSSGGG